MQHSINMDRKDVSNRSPIEAAKDKYKTWSAGMKQKFAGDETPYLLLGKDSFPLTSDGRFENPIYYHEFPFWCLEVAYKFAKYYSEENAGDDKYSIFFTACHDKSTTGQKVRNLEKALIHNIVPVISWSADSHHKIDIMNNLMTQKFQNNSDLLEILKETGDREIIAPSFCVSGNGMPWGDRVYEVEFDENYEHIGGENILGKILMEIRNKL
jgi:NADAR domain